MVKLSDFIVRKICKPVVYFSVFFLSAGAAAQDLCISPIKTSSMNTKSQSCTRQYVESFFFELNCKIDFVGSVMDKRAINWLKEGAIDFRAGLTMTEERKEYLEFSVPYAQQFFTLVTRADDDRFKQVTSWCDSHLKQSYIIIKDGIFISKEVDSLKQTRNCAKGVVEAKGGYTVAAEMLIKGRGDVLIISETWLARIRRYNPPLHNQLKQIPLQLWPDKLSFAFNKQFAQSHPALIDAVNNQIKKHIAHQRQICSFSRL